MSFVFRALSSRVAAVVVMILLAAPAALAQERIWIQIEAHPVQAKASERAQAYAAVFPETEAYRLRSGWFGVVLGPYGVAEGAAQLNGLLRENLIPSDSFITDGTEFAERFWPSAGAAPLVSPAPGSGSVTAPDAAVEPDAVQPAEPVVAEEPEETLREARASEAALTGDERKLLQTALQWFGHYAGGIDGAIGPGSRKAMAAWQEAQGLEPTGVLTTRQRLALLSAYQDGQAAYGFATVVESKAGIEVTLPLALVEFDRYEPPFVHFREKNGSGLGIVLISQPGDIAAFYGLYDVLQTLDAMPLTGERSRSDRQFRIRGTSARHDSTAFAQFERGFIKGWMVLSSPATAERDARVVAALEQSFRGIGDTALDPGLVPLEEATRRGLLAGLDVRRPRFSRSGFYIGPEGRVLTTLGTVEGCGRVTIERDQEMTVALTDAASGLAVLTPVRPLAPPAVAAFQLAPDLPGTEIAVAGYSYEDRLPAPVLTFGTLEDVQGLDGEPGVKRLALSALPGDAGGPVLDPTGAVLGMLLPAPADGSRVLPEGVSFAAASARIAAVLSAANIPVMQAGGGGALPPEDLSRRATDLTVLVSCWD